MGIEKEFNSKNLKCYICGRDIDFDYTKYNPYYNEEYSMLGRR